jgi:hypothetical protein
MPYTYEKTDDGYDVFKDGEKVGHVEGSKEDLDKYLAALHASEDKEAVLAEKQLSLEQIRDKIRRFANESTQDEDDYFFIEETYPDFAIVCNGTDRFSIYFTMIEGDFVITDVVPVVRTYVPLENTKNFLQRAKEFFGAKKQPEGFQVRKEADGRYRWIAVSSTAHRDRDKQIISTKALQRDVEQLDEIGDYGHLNYWHVPELIIGNCDFRMLEGRMLIESGTIFDEKVATALSKEKHKVSIEFYHPVDEPDKEGVFHTIITKGRAVLPPGYEANPFTTVKGVYHEMDNEQKTKKFVQLLGGDEEAQELVGSILKDAQEIQKDADLVADFKETEEPVEEPVVEEEVVEEPQFDPEAIKEALKEFVQTAIEEKLQVFVEAQKEAEQSKVEDYTEALKEVARRLKTLEDDMPAIAKQYVASADKDTIVQEDDPAMKSVSKESETDPIFDLMKNLKIGEV